MRKAFDVAKVTLSELHREITYLFDCLSSEQQESLSFETDETSLYICFDQTPADALVMRVNKLQTSVMADVTVVTGDLATHIANSEVNGLLSYIYRAGDEYVAICEGPIVRAYKVSCTWLPV